MRPHPSTKLPPVKKNYRDYRNFNSVLFLNEVNIQLKNRNIVDYSIFERIFVPLLNEHGPQKTKVCPC